MLTTEMQDNLLPLEILTIVKGSEALIRQTFVGPAERLAEMSTYLFSTSELDRAFQLINKLNDIVVDYVRRDWKTRAGHHYFAAPSVFPPIRAPCLFSVVITTNLPRRLLLAEDMIVLTHQL